MYTNGASGSMITSLPPTRGTFAPVARCKVDDMSYYYTPIFGYARLLVRLTQSAYKDAYVLGKLNNACVIGQCQGFAIAMGIIYLELSVDRDGTVHVTHTIKTNIPNDQQVIANVFWARQEKL